MASSEGITPASRVKFSEDTSGEEANPQTVTPDTPKTKSGLPTPKGDGNDGNNLDDDDGDMPPLMKRDELYESDDDEEDPTF